MYINVNLYWWFIVCYSLSWVQQVSQFTPVVVELSYIASFRLGRIQQLCTLMCCSYSQSLQFSFFFPPGTHHCWVDRGGMIWEVLLKASTQVDHRPHIQVLTGNLPVVTTRPCVTEYFVENFHQRTRLIGSCCNTSGTESGKFFQNSICFEWMAPSPGHCTMIIRIPRAFGNFLGLELLLRWGNYLGLDFLLVRGKPNYLGLECSLRWGDSSGLELLLRWGIIIILLLYNSNAGL